MVIVIVVVAIPVVVVAVITVVVRPVSIVAGATGVSIAVIVAPVAPSIISTAGITSATVVGWLALIGTVAGPVIISTAAATSGVAPVLPRHSFAGGQGDNGADCEKRAEEKGGFHGGIDGAAGRLFSRFHKEASLGVITGCRNTGRPHRPNLE